MPYLRATKAASGKAAAEAVKFITPIDAGQRQFRPLTEAGNIENSGTVSGALVRKAMKVIVIGVDGISMSLGSGRRYH